MGFFSLKVTCCLCKNKVGLNRYRLADKKEHWICSSCFKKCGFTPKVPMILLTVENCERRMRIYQMTHKEPTIPQNTNENSKQEDVSMDYTIFNNERQRGVSLFSFPNDYVVIDIETTGLSPNNCEIIELSALKVENNEITDTFTSLVKPAAPIPESIQKLTGITNEMVSGAPSIVDILPSYIDFLGKNIVLGHNVTFDISFLHYYCEKCIDCTFPNNYIDTLRISRKLISDIDNYKLGTLAAHFNIPQEAAHRALDDCKTTNELFINLKALNKETEDSFVSLFENVEPVLAGKTVVFKGVTSFCSFDSYCSICEKAGGKATDIFYRNADYIVFGKTTYAKYKRGDFSNKMLKATELEKEGALKILSEPEFLKMLGHDVPSHPNRSHPDHYHSHIDIKSMEAQTDDFDESHPLFGKVCVFTGTLDKMQRKDAMQAVLDHGGEIGNGVTKKTNFLILGCNDFCSSIKDGKSSKHKKAEEYQLKGYDIEIIDEDLFYAMLEE